MTAPGSDHSDGLTPVGSEDPPPVEEQRKQLAETVDALGRKLDVSRRVSGAATDTARSAQAKVRENQPLVIVVGVVAAAVIATFVIRRRRHEATS